MRLADWVGLFALMVPWGAMGATPKSCVPAGEASRMVKRDVCVSAHVYDVVQLADGTRFLDVCTPETPDDACRFTIVSRWEDHEDVGELRKYRDMDVQVRGIVVHARADGYGAEP